MVEKKISKICFKCIQIKKAVSFFIGDNCGGDNFYYTTENRMEQAIAYWLWDMTDRGLSIGLF